MRAIRQAQVAAADRVGGTATVTFGGSRSLQGTTPRERQAKGPAVALAGQALRQPGQALPADTASLFERGFAHNFADIRVHVDAAAAAAASALRARAFSAGSNIVFAAGQYAPGSAAGRSLLGHELAHVMQVREGRVPATSANLCVGDHPGLEREADQLSQRVSAGGRIAATREPARPALTPMSSRTILRQPVPPVADPYPTRRAFDFEPDHVFLELLSHDFAYRNDLDGKFLYRAYQSPYQGAPITFGLDGAALPDQPTSLLDCYAASDGFPEVGGESPLVYGMKLMTGSDPKDEKDGLTAYFLEPAIRPEMPRILVFRGTEVTKADVSSDAAHLGVGAPAYNSHAADVRALLFKWRTGPAKVIVTGHSLGGALAQWAAAANPGLVDEVVTFNAPGISAWAAAQFGKMVATGLGTVVHHYVTRGDVVSTAGEARLPGEVTTLESDATHALEALLDSGNLERADRFLVPLLAVVDLLSVKIILGLAAAAELAATMYRSGALEGFVGLTLLGPLHSQRLLHAAMMQRESPFTPMVGRWESGSPSTDNWIPAASALSETEPGVGRVKTSKLSTKTSAANEAARAGLGNPVFLGSVGILFNETIPLLTKLIDNIVPLAETGQLGVSLSLLQEIARGLAPLLHQLVPQLLSIGGLEGMIENSLYRKRVYAPPYHYQQPRVEPDVLRVAPSPRLGWPRDR